MSGFPPSTSRTYVGAKKPRSLLVPIPMSSGQAPNHSNFHLQMHYLRNHLKKNNAGVCMPVLSNVIKR